MYTCDYDDCGGIRAREVGENCYYFEVTDLIKCVVKLFDRGEKQPSIRVACLDIWDQLFRSNIQAIKQLSNLIDDFE